MLAPSKKSYDKPRQHIKKQRHCFANKGLYSQSYGFPVVMYGCESWTIKAERQRIDAFESWCCTLESLLNSKEIKPVNPKENKPWIFTGKTDAEAPILWSPDAKSQLIRKDSNAGIDWRQEEKGTTEDKMVGWHHQLEEPEFEQTLGKSEGQGTGPASVHGFTKSWTRLAIE